MLCASQYKAHSTGVYCGGKYVKIPVISQYVMTFTYVLHYVPQTILSEWYVCSACPADMSVHRNVMLRWLTNCHLVLLQEWSWSARYKCCRQQNTKHLHWLISWEKAKAESEGQLLVQQTLIEVSFSFENICIQYQMHIFMDISQLVTTQELSRNISQCVKLQLWKKHTDNLELNMQIKPP